MIKSVRTPVLEIAYAETGPADGRPVVLMHGFPDDIHAYDNVAPPLAAAGHRVVVPYLRGYGPTRFLDPGTPRSGEQAALGRDLLDLIEALDLEKPILAGYDWGGRAACVVSALWPERVGGLVTIGGYNIQNIATANRPQSAEAEHRYWYQWYFHTERGVAGLAENRGPLCRLLWELWSPNYRFSDADYAKTATSFDNPDFVAVVIQSYRHRYGNAPGDPQYAGTEARLAQRPKITVPTFMLYGAADGVSPPNPKSAQDARQLDGDLSVRVIPEAGHFLPREAPQEVVDAIRVLHEDTGTE
jgi:pimeloyl-ACP methyl ester carboxylesterase